MKNARARIQAPAVTPELVSFLDQRFPERVSRKHEDNLITLGARRVITYLRKLAEEQHNRTVEFPSVSFKPQDASARSGDAAPGSTAAGS